MRNTFSREEVLRVRDTIAQYKNNVSERYEQQLSKLNHEAPCDSPDSRYLHSLLLIVGSYEICLQEIDNLLSSGGMSDK